MLQGNVQNVWVKHETPFHPADSGCYHFIVRSQQSQDGCMHFAYLQGLVISCVCKLQGKADGVLIDDNLGFSKERCISRLTEMQSYEYLIGHAKKHSPQLLLALQEAAEKTGRKSASVSL